MREVDAWIKSERADHRGIGRGIVARIDADVRRHQGGERRDDGRTLRRDHQAGERQVLGDVGPASEDDVAGAGLEGEVAELVGGRGLLADVELEVAVRVGEHRRPGDIAVRCGQLCRVVDGDGEALAIDVAGGVRPAPGCRARGPARSRSRSDHSPRVRCRRWQSGHWNCRARCR